MDFLKPETVLDLTNIRNGLVRMEDTVVFNLIERAQFYSMPSVYTPGAIPVPNFDGSFLDYLLLEYEKLHSKVRRYQAPDEHAYFPNEIEEPILPAIDYPPVLAAYSKEINVNDLIKDYYIKKVVPLVAPVQEEQPENVGSCTLCDIDVLQAVSRRVHFGKFVAETKFRAEREKYTALIRAQDAKGIDEAITNSAVEQQILERLSLKAETYGVDPTLRYSQRAQGQIKPEALVEIYRDCIIPLTKKVEVDYLLRRLEVEDNEIKRD